MGRILLLTLTVLLLTGMAHDANAGARRSRPVKTGATACWDSSGNVIGCAGTGQDGELRRGEPRAYLDNGNGTISDRRTALMWEKLSDDGSIHDKDNSYTWDNAFGKIDDLNAAAFAGHTDWRLPNRFELETILNVGVSPLAVSSVFNSNSGPGCSVTTCSCTAPGTYWSSSTYESNPKSAWVVDFEVGGGGSLPKTTALNARAVGGGS